MPERNFQDKTEPATPKRKQQAREKGQVAKSREIPSIAVLSAGVIYLYFAAPGLTAGLGDFIKVTFARIPQFASSSANLADLVSHAVTSYFRIIIPVLLILCVIAILANVLQTGFVWSVEALSPKASKIDPIQGLRRILSKRSLVELAKSIAKIAVVGWAAFSTLEGEFTNLLPLIYQDDIQILTALGRISLKVITRCCWVIIVLAVLDYLYQKWEFEQGLKMTKQEVKEEFRQTEGDPQIKARIKSIQREMARRRMMEEVPKADVVITNPEHLAIALRYEPGKMNAPRVIAKGADRLALRIREVAREHRIPLLENRPLAQNLYKLDVGDDVPPQFYQAVAEILAYVYSLKKREI